MILYEGVDRARYVSRHVCDVEPVKAHAVGTIARCDACGQFFILSQSDGDDYGVALFWDRISDRKARRILRRRV